MSQAATAVKPGPLRNRLRLRERMRDRDTAIYGILLIAALIFPLASIYATGTTFYITQAGHAGTWVLLAIGLNVVVGFAGLLDLGYAAFFAIGAYTYALFASDQLGASPVHHSFHLPFWLMIIVAITMLRRRSGDGAHFVPLSTESARAFAPRLIAYEADLEFCR